MNERRPRRRPGENREQLVKAGLIEFGLHGYHGASTAAIARRAGVPQPHVYTNFRTKLDLFEACAERALDLLDGSDNPPEAGETARAEQLLLQLVAALADRSASEALSALRTRVVSAFGASTLAEHLAHAAEAILAPAEPAGERPEGHRGE